MDRKLRHKTDEELAHGQLAAEQRQAARDFGSVEELLRQDAEQTAVPPHIATRVRESIAREPRPRGFWGRLFGR